MLIFFFFLFIGKPNNWAQETKSDPLPIYYKLGSILELFDKIFMKDIGVNIKAIRRKLSKCLKVRQYLKYKPDDPEKKYFCLIKRKVH